MWTQIVDAIQKNQQFIISSHVNPDCDALGSELALAYYLKSLGKTVSILNSDPVISDYAFLDPENLIMQFSGTPQQRKLISQAQVIIVVDASSSWQRLGKVGRHLSKSNALSLCIDHHPNEAPFTDIAVVDTNVIATGELIFDLIASQNGQITDLMAQALYAAILTDSGSFRFPKTSASTHRITASLIEYGANPSDVYRQLYEQQQLQQVQLKGYVLKNIKLAAQGQVAYVGLSAEILTRYNTDPSGLNAFSNLAQQIGGVKIAITAIEMPDGRIKLGFRSDGSVAVNGIARSFGGGGHAPAAGATLPGQLEEILASAVDKACQLVDA